jgi:hypothetical protein
MRRLPGLIVILVTRARVRIVKRLLGGRPLQAVPVALRCGIECPSAEDLAAYIDNRLAGNRRMEIDEHLAKCRRCFEVFEEVLRFNLEQEHA